MKKSHGIFMMSVLMLSLAGCSAHVAEPKTQASAPELPRKDESCNRDGFDKAGEYGASGVRWAWDETKQAWGWLTSDEMKARASSAWEATKKAATDAYDKASESVHEHSK